jgi:hypothetical protein
VPTPIPTATPSPTLIPTVTPQPGIVMFDVFDCHNVRWLAWAVSRVYLTVGRSRTGVAGDDRGQPVTRDLCEYAGQTIRLDVYIGNVQTFREGVLSK